MRSLTTRRIQRVFEVDLPRIRIVSSSIRSILRRIHKYFFASFDLNVAAVTVAALGVHILEEIT